MIDFCLNIDTKSPYLFCKKYKWTSWKNLVFAVVKNALGEVYIELLTLLIILTNLFLNR